MKGEILNSGFLLFRDLHMDSLPALTSRNTNTSIPMKIPIISFKKGELIIKRFTSPKYSITEIFCNQTGNENGELVA